MTGGTFVLVFCEKGRAGQPFPPPGERVRERFACGQLPLPGGEVRVLDR